MTEDHGVPGPNPGIPTFNNKMSIKLIINADDFGMSSVYNEVILDLIKEEKISSTTVMVNRYTSDQKSQLDELINLSKEKNISVGLHLEFVDDDYEKSVREQFAKFKKLLGFAPSHIDIHKGNKFPDSFPIVYGFCKNNTLPLRNKGFDFGGVTTTDTKYFFGSIDNFKEIEDWVDSLENGTTNEILFHPGKYDPNSKSSLNKDRERDVDHIKKLHSLLKEKNIELVSFNELK